jgi:hypothetical protein
VVHYLPYTRRALSLCTACSTCTHSCHHQSRACSTAQTWLLLAAAATTAAASISYNGMIPLLQDNSYIAKWISNTLKLGNASIVLDYKVANSCHVIRVPCVWAGRGGAPHSRCCQLPTANSLSPVHPTGHSIVSLHVAAGLQGSRYGHGQTIVQMQCGSWGVGGGGGGAVPCWGWYPTDPNALDY